MGKGGGGLERTVVRPSGGCVPVGMHACSGLPGQQLLIEHNEDKFTPDVKSLGPYGALKSNHTTGQLLWWSEQCSGEGGEGR